MIVYGQFIFFVNCSDPNFCQLPEDTSNLEYLNHLGKFWMVTKKRYAFDADFCQNNGNDVEPALLENQDEFDTWKYIRREY